MGKIKGWERAKNGDTIWFSKRTKISIGEKIIIVDGKVEFSKEGYVLNITNLKSINKQFNTKQQAIDYAMKYMRSHPNG